MGLLLLFSSAFLTMVVSFYSCVSPILLLLRPKAIAPKNIYIDDRFLSLDFQLADTEEGMKRLDMVTSLEMLSPLLLEGLDNFALGLFNDRGLDGVILGRDIGSTLDSVVL